MSLRFKLAFETKAPDFSIASEDSQDKTLDECGQHLDDAEKALEQINQLNDVLSTASDKLTVAEESFFVMHLNKLRYDLGVENYELSTESFKSSKSLAVESLSKVGNAVVQAIKTLIKKIKEIVMHFINSGKIRQARIKTKLDWLGDRLSVFDTIKSHLNDTIEVDGLNRISLVKFQPKNGKDVITVLNKTLEGFIEDNKIAIVLHKEIHDKFNKSHTVKLSAFDGEVAPYYVKERIGNGDYLSATPIKRLSKYETEDILKMIPEVEKMAASVMKDTLDRIEKYEKLEKQNSETGDEKNSIREENKPGIREILFQNVSFENKIISNIKRAHIAVDAVLLLINASMTDGVLDTSVKLKK